MCRIPDYFVKHCLLLKHEKFSGCVIPVVLGGQGTPNGRDKTSGFKMSVSLHPLGTWWHPKTHRPLLTVEGAAWLGSGQWAKIRRNECSVHSLYAPPCMALPFSSLHRVDWALRKTEGQREGTWVLRWLLERTPVLPVLQARTPGMKSSIVWWIVCYRSEPTWLLQRALSKQTTQMPCFSSKYMSSAF